MIESLLSMHQINWIALALTLIFDAPFGSFGFTKDRTIAPQPAVLAVSLVLMTAF
jgi:hypothetical protein